MAQGVQSGVQSAGSANGESGVRWLKPSQDEYGAAYDRGMGTFQKQGATANAAYLAADVNGDGFLSFAEFSALVRDAEKFERKPSSESTLKRRFAELDADGSGSIEVSEYLRFALLEALSKSHKRVIDLVMAWDKDNDKFVGVAEFRAAVRALGFQADDNDIDAVFRAIDEDGSGSLSFQELQASLRPSTTARNKHALRRQGSGSRKTVLSTASRLIATPGGESVQAQLRKIVVANRVRVMDLFREWDVNGDGQVTSSEFAGALLALGYEADRHEISALFDEFDADGSGALDFGELHAALRDGAVAAASGAEETGVESMRKRFVRKVAPTYGSRPISGWTSTTASWSETEGLKALERARRRQISEQERRRAIQMLRECPTTWSDAGVDYSRGLPPPSRSSSSALSQARAEESMQRYEDMVAVARVQPLSREKTIQWWRDAVMWKETGFRAPQRHTPRTPECTGAGAVEANLMAAAKRRQQLRA